MQKKQVKNKESEKPNEVEITKMQFTIGETIYSVPICWQAVTFSKYLDWVNEWVMCFPSEAEMLSGTHESADIEYPIRMLSFQTDVPIEVLKQCSLDGLEQLKETQMFWFDFEALNGFNYAPKLPNIDEAPVKFMIEFVHGVKGLGDKQPINLAPDIIKNYFDIDILNEPLPKYYGLATFFLSNLAITGLRFKDKYNLSRQVQTKLRRVLACLKVSY